MSDVHELLKRQAQWQKGRRTLTWPEKIRMAEQVRESIAALRAANTSLPRQAARSSPLR